MALDPTASSYLESIAAKLEAKAGIPTPDSQRDPSVESKLQRIDAALDDFVGSIETHSLTEHTDAAISSPLVRQVLRYNGAKFINTHLTLSDLGDVDDNLNPGSIVIVDPSDRPIFNWDGTRWGADLLSLDSLQGVIDAQPGPSWVLKGNGFNWTGDVLFLNDIFDISLAVPANFDLLAYDIVGGEWLNYGLPTILGSILTSNGDLLTKTAGTVVRLPVGSANQFLGISGGLPTWVSQSAIDHGSQGGLSDVEDHPGYVTLDGTRALTANWNSGAFTIDSQRFRSTQVGLTPGHTIYLSDSTSLNNVNHRGFRSIVGISETGSPPSSRFYHGLEIDLDYAFNGVTSQSNPRAISITHDSVLTAGTVLNTPEVIGVDVNIGSGIGISARPVFDFDVIDNTGLSRTEASFRNTLTTSGTQTLSMKFLNKNSSAVGGSGDYLGGIQGYADAQTAYLGNTLGVWGFTAAEPAGANGAFGFLATPAQGGSALAADKKVAYKASGGAIHIAGGNLIVEDTPNFFSRPADISTTHLNFLTTVAQGYFKGAVEVDGTVYGDNSGIAFEALGDILVNADNKKMLVGDSGSRGSFYHDGTDLVLKTNEAGSGILNFIGLTVAAITSETLSEYVTVKIGGISKKLAVVA